MTEQLRELLDTVNDLHSHARRLRVVADRLDADAALLAEDVLGNGSQRIGGRAMIDKLMDVTEPGEIYHYRDLERLLRSAGYVVNGIDPANTLLTRLRQSPYWTAVGSRTGTYRRNAPVSLPEKAA